MFSKISIRLIAVAILFVGCKKNSTPPIDNTSKNSPLLVGKWQVISESSDKPFDWASNGQTETDIYSTLSSCEKKSTRLFDPGGVGSLFDSCSYTIKDISWSLVDNGNTIKWGIENQGSLEENIISIGVESLTTTYQLQPNNTQLFTITTTYIKL